MVLVLLLLPAPSSSLALFPTEPANPTQNRHRQGLRKGQLISQAVHAKEWSFDLSYQQSYAESITPTHKPPAKVQGMKGRVQFKD